MCFSVLVRAKIEELEKEYGATAVSELWRQLYETQRVDPKKTKFIANRDDRIYPMYYAPIIYKKDNELVIEPMRYSTFSPLPMRKYTSYNARRDNLTSPFWADAFGKNHGFIVIKAFYEWVAVKNLIKAGVVKLEQIKEEFRKKSEERKKQLLEKGKKYYPTKNELQEAIFKDIIIEFKPEKNEDLLVPVIFNSDPAKENPFKGFAIITDEPTPEIKAAGHDRCPIILAYDAIKQWLKAADKSNEEIQIILRQNIKHFFKHQLDKVA